MGKRMGAFQEAKPWRRFETKEHIQKRKRRIRFWGTLSVLIWGLLFSRLELFPKVSRETFFEEDGAEGSELLEVFGIRLRLEEAAIEFYRKEPES